MGETDARVLTQGVTPPLAEAIRPAATIVILRQSSDGAQVLMGQRGAAAAFMPSKYVFPGGGVDAADHAAPAPQHLAPACHARLSLHPLPDMPSPGALATAALRELVEETGLTLIAPAGSGPDSDPALRFIFRAITPPGRSRRFDARFFLLDATRLDGDMHAFSAASDELSHLHWIGLSAARSLDLPFITEVVLAEVAALLDGQPDHGVPFFDNSGPVPTFRRLR